MITSIEIENLRGIAKGKIEGLAPLTVLVGPNNSGKSTILDALRVVGKKGDLEAWDYILRRRSRLTDPSMISDVVHMNGRTCCISEVDETMKRTPPLPPVRLTYRLRLNADLTPELASDPRNRERPKPWLELESQLLSNVNPAHSSVQISLYDGTCSCTEPLLIEGNLIEHGPVVLLDTDRVRVGDFLANAYQNALTKGDEALDNVAKLCSLFEPGLRKILMGDKSVVYQVFGNRSIPLHVAGDGVKRLFHIACWLAACRGGLVLIEEPESYLHPKALNECVKLLWVAIGQGTQVVMSTHSLEFLHGLFEKEDDRDLLKGAVFMTKLSDGSFLTHRIPGPNASERMGEVGEDLRQ